MRQIFLISCIETVPVVPVERRLIEDVFRSYIDMVEHHSPLLFLIVGHLSSNGYRARAAAVQIDFVYPAAAQQIEIFHLLVPTEASRPRNTDSRFCIPGSQIRLPDIVSPVKLYQIIEFIAIFRENGIAQTSEVYGEPGRLIPPPAPVA